MGWYPSVKLRLIIVRNGVYYNNVFFCTETYTYFSSSQGILKKAHKLSLISRAKKQDALAGEAKMFQRDLMNLAFLPANNIEEAFSSLLSRLKQNPELDSIMRPLFDYYKKFWLRQVTPEVFSVFRQKHRTNNVIERYHRTLKKEMASRPNIVKFFGKFLLVVIIHHDLLSCI